MRIVVVDDAAPIRGLLRSLLASLDHEVDAVANLDDYAALSAAGPRRDAVIVDNRLGGADVTTIVTALLRIAATCPVVVLAAVSDVASVRAAIQAGAATAVRRPPQRSDLARALAELPVSRR